MRQIFTLLIFGLLFSSCEKKPVPTSVEGDPVFYVTGQLEGEDLEWLAGKDGMYMHTQSPDIEHGKFAYSGYLANEDCESDCQPKLRFVFFDEAELKEKADPNKIIKSRSTDFVTPELVDVYEVELEPQVWTQEANPNLTFEWDFGDGEVNNEANAKHYFPKNRNGFSVCLDVENTNNSARSSICRDILWEENCSSDFEFRPYQGYYELEVIDPKTDGQYSWAFGSGRFADGSFLQLEYGEASKEKICLTTNTLDGCSSTICKNVVLDSNRARCVANFDYKFSETQIPGTKKLRASKVLIEYTDARGKVWRSDEKIQSGDSFFEILKVEDHEVDENGLSTKKLELTFSCELYNNSSSLSFEDVHASIAVALP